MGKKWRSGSHRSVEELLEPVEWEYRNAYERISRTSRTHEQKRRSHCNRIPMMVRCARVCIALGASERVSEDIHTMRIHASCRVRLDESNRETRSYLALIACTTTREADRVYLYAACLIRSTSNYHISITSIEFVIASIDGAFIIKRKFLYIDSHYSYNVHSYLYFIYGTVIVQQKTNSLLLLIKN